MILRTAAFATTIILAQLTTPEGTPITPPSPLAFKPVVEQLIDRVIVPAYTRLANTATVTEDAVAALCTAPDNDTLAGARDTFADLAGAWSGVEMFRMGPARADNLYERMFFWPDRKGLGLRQVQAILADEDATATGIGSLRGKSVAVQGLLALEYVLFGTGSETLAAPPADSFRCRYGHAIAGAIVATSGEMLAGWTAPDGYATVMRDPGPDNPVYRSHGEVVQDVLRSAREQIQIDRDIKLARPIGDSPEAAVPTQAPFWRSNLTIATVRANLAAVEALVNDGGIDAILPTTVDWMGPSLAFELSSVDAALNRLAATGQSWSDTVRSPGGHETLAYTLVPLGSVFEMLEQRFPVALGLTQGFNTLDGD